MMPLGPTRPMSLTSSMRPKPMIGKIVAADEAIDAIMADEADELDELDEADEAGIVMAPDVPDLLLPFSLTKCCIVLRR
jgi:hypothetical protein